MKESTKLARVISGGYVTIEQAIDRIWAVQTFYRCRGKRNLPLELDVYMDIKWGWTII